MIHLTFGIEGERCRVREESKGGREREIERACTHVVNPAYAASFAVIGTCRTRTMCATPRAAYQAHRAGACDPCGPKTKLQSASCTLHVLTGRLTELALASFGGLGCFPHGDAGGVGVLKRPRRLGRRSRRSHTNTGTRDSGLSCQGRRVRVNKKKGTSSNAVRGAVASPFNSQAL